jgi:hypothetical protein
MFHIAQHQELETGNWKLEKPAPSSKFLVSATTQGVAK